MTCSAVGAARRGITDAQVETDDATEHRHMLGPGSGVGAARGRLRGWDDPR
jgi:hypothetical protein